MTIRLKNEDHCDSLLMFTGIWIRDIRFKSNIQLTQVNKILKNLESKKLIKAVKSVAVSTFFDTVLISIKPPLVI